MRQKRAQQMTEKQKNYDMEENRREKRKKNVVKIRVDGVFALFLDFDFKIDLSCRLYGFGIIVDRSKQSIVIK